MRLNKAGLILLAFNVVLVFGIAIADGLLSAVALTASNGPSETHFLNWMILTNFIPFLVYGLASKVPILGWFYFKTYWTTCFHFAILGGIQWYLIGWGASSIWAKIFIKK